MNHTPHNNGLSEETIRQINTVFAAHPEIERVILYGSRAKGNYRPGSDIDLTITGEPLSLTQLARIEEELDDLLLPYKIDLSELRRIESSDLREQIHRVGRTFYQKN
ncbi:MAG: nucleotidyltransferase domain-containing protein [Gammaproteobacteria bacterium]|nr:nucleotidyltransferase domain-containing protein [Gammaproteobacteria bacterium]MCW8958792.1 nucleotidyltransferase domain-containing protein [Gammaproteobacteria bacterium]